MLKKLEKFLSEGGAKYEIAEHRKVFTAHDAAATQKIDEKVVAKALLVKMDKEFAFAVLSAKKKLDFNKLKKLANLEIKKVQKLDPKIKTVKKVSIAKEADIKKYITKKLGEIAAFGSLYKIKTYLDKSLSTQKKIQLNAGSLTESLIMSASQYIKIEKPVIGNIGK